MTLSQEGDYTGTILILYDSDFKPIPHPTDNIDQTIESTAYELILTQSLEDALDVYEGLNSYAEAGYACKASIYIYDIQLSVTIGGELTVNSKIHGVVAGTEDTDAVTKQEIL